MAGAMFLILLGAAGFVGSAAGRRAWPARTDRWTAGISAMLALVGSVIAVVTVVMGAAIDVGELPIFLAFAVAPVVLTAVPLIVQPPANGTAALTVGCALVLVAYVAIGGLSIGLFFAPAAIALVLLAAARMRHPTAINDL